MLLDHAMQLQTFFFMKKGTPWPISPALDLPLGGSGRNALHMCGAMSSLTPTKFHR